jgi:hypothetical protein
MMPGNGCFAAGEIAELKNEVMDADLQQTDAGDYHQP